MLKIKFDIFLVGGRPWSGTEKKNMVGLNF